MAIKFDELLEALDPSLDKFEEDLDSMWIIIPTERRYDDLTANDYDEFINKYGTFNSRQACWDKIDELAPDRWDAFIPMRIEGINESLNESMKDKNSFIDWLSEHEQAYEDACNYFHTDNLSLIDVEKLENWLYDHEQLAKDYSNHFNTSLNEAANKEKYKVIYEPYERYGSTGLKRATFTASSVFEALCKVCDNLLLNLDLEEIEEEGYTAEDIIDRFSFTNGDGCDYIYTIENLNTGDIIFDGSDMYDDMDDWDIDESLIEAMKNKHRAKSKNKNR